MAIDLLLIAIIIVNITDISGIVDHIENFIAKCIGAKKVSLHILDCSYCQIWWLSMIWLLIHHSFTLQWIAITLLICFFSSFIKDVQYIIRELLIKLLNKIL